MVKVKRIGEFFYVLAEGRDAAGFGKFKDAAWYAKKLRDELASDAAFYATLEALAALPELDTLDALNAQLRDEETPATTF